jgi:hypothetical protein
MDAAIGKSRWHAAGTSVAAAIPLALLVAIAGAMLPLLPDWQAMWLLALAIYFGLKWLTLAAFLAGQGGPARGVSTGRASPVRVLGYLLLWPGMDARAFLDPAFRPVRPKVGEWLLMLVKLAVGFSLLYAVVPGFGRAHPFLAGWTGLAGLVLVLHFGLFHLLSLGWRAAGIEARPIMNWPILATSLADFWGRRWNLAFRDLAFARVGRPLAGRIGVAWATLTVFVASGLIHDLVISVPVRGGWGGPTVYFVVQGLGLLLERSRTGRRLGLGGGVVGRLTCAIFVVAPVGLLFHEPFIRRAILPTLAALGAI